MEHPTKSVGPAALALLTLGFAQLIGKWIDAQSNTMLDDPRDSRKRRK